MACHTHHLLIGKDETTIVLIDLSAVHMHVIVQHLCNMSRDIQPIFTLCVLQVRTCRIKSLVQRGLAAGEVRTTTTWTGTGCLMQFVMFIRCVRVVVSYNSFNDTNT